MTQEWLEKYKILKFENNFFWKISLLECLFKPKGRAWAARGGPVASSWNSYMLLTHHILRCNARILFVCLNGRFPGERKVGILRKEERDFASNQGLGLMVTSLSGQSWEQNKHSGLLDWINLTPYDSCNSVPLKCGTKQVGIWSNRGQYKNYTTLSNNLSGYWS